MDVTDEKSSLVQTRAIPLYKSRSASHIYSLRGRWVNNCLGVRGEYYSYFIDIHDILRMEKLTDHVANPQFIARFKSCASETAMFQQKWFNTMAVEYPVPGAGRVAILWMNLGRIHVSAHTIHHRGKHFTEHVTPTKSSVHLSSTFILLILLWREQCNFRRTLSFAGKSSEEELRRDDPKKGKPVADTPAMGDLVMAIDDDDMDLTGQ